MASIYLLISPTLIPYICILNLQKTEWFKIANFSDRFVLCIVEFYCLPTDNFKKYPKLLC